MDGLWRFFGALPPDLRDLSLSCQSRRAVFLKFSRSTASCPRAPLRHSETKIAARRRRIFRISDFGAAMAARKHRKPRPRRLSAGSVHPRILLRRLLVNEDTFESFSERMTIHRGAAPSKGHDSLVLPEIDRRNAIEERGALAKSPLKFIDYSHKRLEQKRSRRPSLGRCGVRMFPVTGALLHVLHDQSSPPAGNPQLGSAAKAPGCGQKSWWGTNGICFKLVIRHAVILNPAASACGERYQVVEGATSEITVEQARQLLLSIDTRHRL